jgi:hypothetical protein
MVESTCRTARQISPVATENCPMTPDDFRRIALSMPGTEEAFQYGHFQFRLGRKTFAILEDLSEPVAVIKFTQKQQSQFVGMSPSSFLPTEGEFGPLGTTKVRLGLVDEAALNDALAAAWSNVAPNADGQPALERLLYGDG